MAWIVDSEPAPVPRATNLCCKSAGLLPQPGPISSLGIGSWPIDDACGHRRSKRGSCCRFSAPVARVRWLQRHPPERAEPTRPSRLLGSAVAAGCGTRMPSSWPCCSISSVEPEPESPVDSDALRGRAVLLVAFPSREEQGNELDGQALAVPVFRVVTDLRVPEASRPSRLQTAGRKGRLCYLVDTQPQPVAASTQGGGKQSPAAGRVGWRTLAATKKFRAGVGGRVWLLPDCPGRRSSRLLLELPW